MNGSPSVLRFIFGFTLATQALTIVHQQTLEQQHVLTASRFTAKLSASSNSTAQSIPASKCSFSNENAVILPGPISHGACPAECPFSQPLVGDHCAVVCVPATACALFHPARGFPDVISHSCVPTCGNAEEERIAGCEICASRGRCAKCIHSSFGEFVLSNDGTRCQNPVKFFWNCLYIALGTVILGVLYYVFLLVFVREPKNQALVEPAIRHRHVCRPLRMTKSGESGQEGCHQWHSYSYFDTNPHTTTVAGVGVTLYFNLLVFLGCVALAMWLGCQVALYLSANDYSKADALEDNGCVAKTGAGDNTPTLVEDKPSFAFRVFASLGVTYILVLITSWAFFLYQLRAYQWFHKNRTFCSDFAVFLEGLPAEATDDIALRQVLQDKLGDFTDGSVVGVSICYALAEYKQEIEEGVDAWIMERSSSTRYHTRIPDSARSNDSSAAGQVAGFLKLQFIDDLLVNNSPVPEMAKKRIMQVMETSKCSGSAFVVLSNDAAKRQLSNALQEDPHIMGCQVTCEQPSGEPRDVLWKNFARPEDRHFCKKMGIGCLCILATICLWALLYLPYAFEYTALSRVPGHKPAPLEDLILGALIGLGNVLVGNVIELVIEWVGFEFKATRDLWVLGLAFLANLLNVAADLSMTLHVARGAHLDETFDGDSVGYDKVVGRELFSLIVPGYLFVPYLLQPLVEYVLPYCVYRSLIRADPRMHLRKAEKALEPPEFEIVWRYADTLNNFLVCMVLLVFLTPDSGSIMLWLFVFILYIYGLDKLRLIHYSVTTYTSQYLSIAFTLWWAIPTGMLAGIVAWWGVKAGMLIRYDAFTAVCATVIVHVTVYLSGVWLLYVVNEKSKCAKEGEYADALATRRKLGRGWDVFNVNPGHCLRTWGGKDEMFVYTRGKTHLLYEGNDWDCGGASHNFGSDVDESGFMNARLWSILPTILDNSPPADAGP